MALKVGELYAALSLTSDAFKKGLDDSQGHAKKWAGKIGGVFKVGALAIAGALAVAIVAITAVGIKSLDNAEEQERANRRVAKAFGDSADAVNKWASDNARSLGVADDALQTSVARYGEWAQNVGMSAKEAMSQGQALAQRASEISLATGKDFQEVFDSLLKGAQGSTRGLKEFGVAVSPLAIKNEALRLGLIKSGEALTDQAKAAALNSLIMQQTAGFTQAAADAQGSMTDINREMGVVVDEVMDAIGAVFMQLAMQILPYVLDAFEAFSGWLQENMPTIEAIIKMVADGVGVAFTWLADNVIPLLAAAFQWFVDNVVPVLAAALQWYIDNILPALGAAFDFITTTVIPALGAVFQWIIDNILPPLRSIFETFTSVILPALGRAFEGVQQWIKDNWPTISKIVGQVGAAVKTAFEIIANVIKTVAPVIVKIGEVVFPTVGEAAGFLLRAISQAFDAIGAIWQTAADIATTVVKAIGDAWTGLTGVIKTVWDGITGIVKSGANMLIGIINGIIRAVNSIQVHIGRIGLDTPAGFVGVGPFDWNGLNLGELPYLARGARNFGGGWAVVGERGPELVNLPPKSDVYTANESAALAGGSRGAGAGIVTGDVVFQVQQMNASEAEARVFARRLWGYLEDEAFRRGRPLQPVRGGF